MNRAHVNPCPTCVAEGKPGSCAKLRCYCGHRECWAFASYTKPTNTPGGIKP